MKKRKHIPMALLKVARTCARGLDAAGGPSLWRGAGVRDPQEVQDPRAWISMQPLMEKLPNSCISLSHTLSLYQKIMLQRHQGVGQELQNPSLGKSLSLHTNKFSCLCDSVNMNFTVAECLLECTSKHSQTETARHCQIPTDRCSNTRGILKKKA